MRRILHGDVSAAACVLYLLKQSERAGMLARLMTEADAADTYRLKCKSLHPVWGDGSLMSTALAYPYASEPPLDDPEYAACMAMVYDAIAANRKIKL